MSSRGMFSVPLKFMCSTQCDTPVRPGSSSPDPTRYQHQTETRGAVWSSWTRIFRPLSRNREYTRELYRPVWLIPCSLIHLYRRSRAMKSARTTLAVLSLLLLGVTGAHAQDRAFLTLRSGEKVVGQLVDLG